MADRREQLRVWYGLDFPDDLFAVWELARALRPSDPRDAFDDISIRLGGVFDVLADVFDASPPTGRLWTHDFSYNDPPEFFTIFWGNGDHLGLWFDDPAEKPTCVVSYYNNDAYDLGHYPANLFLMLRRELEEQLVGSLENDEQEAVAPIDALREALRPHMPGASRRRTQTGEDYLDRYTYPDVDDWGVVAETWGRECIRAPADTYRAPKADDETIWREVQTADGAARWLKEAQRALEAPYPATALKLGKDLRHLADKAVEPDACAIMVAAYRALGRPLLAEVLMARTAQRDAWDAERAAP